MLARPPRGAGRVGAMTGLRQREGVNILGALYGRLAAFTHAMQCTVQPATVRYKYIFAEELLLIYVTGWDEIHSPFPEPGSGPG